MASNAGLERDVQIAPETGAIPGGALPLRQLVNIVEQYASRSEEWIGQVRLFTDRRWYQRLHLAPDYDVWAISWMPGQSTGFHDHGASSGAFAVVTGLLKEQRPSEPPRVVSSGTTYSFFSGYTHNVGNFSLGPAVSVHVYSPPLTEMNEYEFEGSRLVPRDRGSRSVDQVRQRPTRANQHGAQGIDGVLAAARARLRRLTPQHAYQLSVAQGAALVDIRPAEQRAVEGEIPGALVVERNVLEWRFDPASSARLPIAANHDVQVIIVCSEGYTSSLAAAALQDLGLWRATDVVGGFQSWRDAGLPTVPFRKSRD